MAATELAVDIATPTQLTDKLTDRLAPIFWMHHRPNAH